MRPLNIIETCVYGAYAGTTTNVSNLYCIQHLSFLVPAFLRVVYKMRSCVVFATHRTNKNHPAALLFTFKYIFVLFSVFTRSHARHLDYLNFIRVCVCSINCYVYVAQQLLSVPSLFENK